MPEGTHSIGGFDRLPYTDLVARIDAEEFAKQVDERPDLVERELNACFEYQVPILPQDGQAFRFRLPIAYDKIVEREIDERFPADGDARSVVREYRRKFVRNAAKKIVMLRLLFLIVAGVAVFLYGSGLADFEVMMNISWAITNPAAADAVSLAALYAGLIAVFVVVSMMVEWLFSTALYMNSAILSFQVSIRLSDLVNCVQFFRNRIAQAQYEVERSHPVMDGSGDAKVAGWRASFDVLFLIWLARRIEFIEKFAQLEFWRTRQWHWIIDRTSVVAFAGIALGLHALTEFGHEFGVIAPGGIEGSAVYRSVLLTVFGTLLVFLGERNRVADFSFLSRNIDTSGWPASRYVQFERMIAEQLERDKEFIDQLMRKSEPQY